MIIRHPLKNSQSILNTLFSFSLVCAQTKETMAQVFWHSSSYLEKL